MYWQEPQEIPQGQMPVSAPAGDSPGNGTGWGLPGWQQPWGKGLGGQGAGQEAAVCPGSKGGHQHPGLCDQDHSQATEGRDSLESSIWISDPHFRKDLGKLEWV